MRSKSVETEQSEPEETTGAVRPTREQEARGGRVVVPHHEDDIERIRKIIPLIDY